MDSELDDLRQKRKKMVHRVKEDRRVLASLISDVNLQRESIARLEEREELANNQLVTLSNNIASSDGTSSPTIGDSNVSVKQISSSMSPSFYSDSHSSSPAENRPNFATAFSEAFREQSLLTKQLRKIAKEISSTEEQLLSSSVKRAEDHRSYLEDRMEAEAAQAQETSTVASDLAKYTELLQVEAQETEILLDSLSSSLADRTSELDSLNGVRKIVLEDRRQLNEAWRSQEDALDDSLFEIENRSAILEKQSAALRKSIDSKRKSLQIYDKVNKEHGASNTDKISELEAELYHVLSLMQTQHRQLARIRQRLLIITEERRVINGKISKWISDSDRRRETVLCHVSDIREAWQSTGAQLELVRAMSAATMLHGGSTNKDRPDVEMLDHISRICGDPSFSKTGTKTVLKGIRRMWLGGMWKKRDIAEKEAESKFLVDKKRFKEKIKRLKKVQAEATEQLACHNVSLEGARRLVLAKNGTESKSTSFSERLAIHRINLDEKLSALKSQHDAAMINAEQLEIYDAQLEDLEKKVKMEEDRRREGEKEEEEEIDTVEDKKTAKQLPRSVGKASKVSIHVQSSTVQASSGNSYAMLLTNSRKKKKRKRKRILQKINDPMMQNVERYTGEQLQNLHSQVLLLQEGAVFCRGVSISHGENTTRERWLQLSDDLSRLEVILPETPRFGSYTGTGTRREAYYRLDKIYAVRLNGKQESFSLYFKDNKSNSQTFDVASEYTNISLEAWVKALSLLVHHTQETGGMSRVKVCLRTLDL